MRRTNTFRIKRTFDHSGRTERRINTDTLQQLWMERDGSGRGTWKDVPIVETEDDGYELYDECPEKKNDYASARCSAVVGTNDQ